MNPCFPSEPARLYSNPNPVYWLDLEDFANPNPQKDKNKSDEWLRNSTNSFSRESAMWFEERSGALVTPISDGSSSYFSSKKKERFTEGTEAWG